MSIYVCPVCGKPLETAGNAYKCGSGHSFDIARSGYVNLLISQRSSKSGRGDNKLMVRARRDFLEKGFYSPLRDAVCRAAVESFAGGAVLDAGCGEGYYTGAILDRLNKANIAADVYGFDISKIAVEFAAKSYKSISFAAASAFHIPVADASCGLLTTIFSPYCGEEFLRVLKPGGVMIMAIPGAEHLWELKRAIYDIPYKNEVKPYELEGFEHVGKEVVRYEMELRSREDIRALFSMTPYCYRTGAEQRERLFALTELDTAADFEILVYRKK